jgi:hypothetical protein
VQLKIHQGKNQSVFSTTLSIEDVCGMSLIGSRFIYNDHKSN